MDEQLVMPGCPVPMTMVGSPEEFLIAMVAMYEAADHEGAKNQYHCVLELVKMLGFQYAVYMRRRPVPLAEPRYETIHNLPASLAKLCDELTEDGNSGFRLWNSQQTRTEKSYWGWTVRMGSTSKWDASLAGISDRPLTVDNITRALIVCTAHLAHWLLSRGLERTIHTRNKLSQREVQVLQWTGDGKTSADIASLLSVSENTVNFHHKNIKDKLSCSTKTSSAVYAAMLGLLS